MAVKLMRYVYCQTMFVGFHRWLKAPKVVEFLRNLHRHVFHVKVTVRVDHDDRDVEFITLKLDVESIIQDLGLGQPTDPDEEERSCEQFALMIGQQLSARKYNVASVDVSEDGENGAMLAWTGR